MKRKYSIEELVKLYDAKDWAALWKIVTPMVKHAVRRCMQEGLDPYYVRDDLMQEAYLAAWEAIPKWNAFEAGLQTWINQKVRSAVLDANRRESSGMVGGRDNGGYVVSMHGETPEWDSSSDDEQGLSDAIESSLVYENPPEGYEDPATRIDMKDLLSRFPFKYHSMLRRIVEVGVSGYAASIGVHRDTVYKQLRALRLRDHLLNAVKTVSTKRPEPANHTMKTTTTRGRKTC